MCLAETVNRLATKAMNLTRFLRVYCREATTGQEALDAIMQEPPDVVLLDLKLPGLDGWETARRIRALPTPLNALPIIAVTTQAMPGDCEKALAAGCDGYMAKPIDFGELREKLEQAARGWVPDSL